MMAVYRFFAKCSHTNAIIMRKLVNFKSLTGIPELRDKIIDRYRAELTLSKSKVVCLQERARTTCKNSIRIICFGLMSGIFEIVQIKKKINGKVK